MGEADAGISVLTVPPIFTVKELKSFNEGTVPNAAPVMVAPSEVPTDAPLSKLITVLADKLGAVKTRVDVAEVMVKLVPLSTLTLKSSVPSIARSCFCISAAKSASVAVVGDGARLKTAPSKVMEKFLKSLTEGVLPN